VVQEVVGSSPIFHPKGTILIVPFFCAPNLGKP